jgi:hypothetical protein
MWYWNIKEAGSFEFATGSDQIIQLYLSEPIALYESTMLIVNGVFTGSL